MDYYLLCIMLSFSAFYASCRKCITARTLLTCSHSSSEFQQKKTSRFDGNHGIYLRMLGYRAQLRMYIDTANSIRQLLRSFELKAV